MVGFRRGSSFYPVAAAGAVVAADDDVAFLDLSVHVHVAVLLLLLLELAGKLRHSCLVLGEDGVHREVDIAVGSDAAQLLRNVVDDRLAAVVELGFAEVPRLLIPNHGVELVHGCNQGELGVFQDLGISRFPC